MMTDESIITNYVNNITLLPHTVLACWQVLVKLKQKGKTYKIRHETNENMCRSKIRMRCFDFFQRLMIKQVLSLTSSHPSRGRYSMKHDELTYKTTEARIRSLCLVQSRVSAILSGIHDIHSGCISNTTDLISVCLQTHCGQGNTIETYRQTDIQYVLLIRFYTFNELIDARYCES